MSKFLYLIFVKTKNYALKESSESIVNSRQLCSLCVKLKVKTVESCKTFVDNETLVCLCLAYIYSCQLFQNGIRTNLNGKTCARFCLFLFGHKRYYLSDRNFYIQGTAYNGQLNKTYILKFNRLQIIFTFFFNCTSYLWDLVLRKMYPPWLQKCISNICWRL